MKLLDQRESKGWGQKLLISYLRWIPHKQVMNKVGNSDWNFFW